MTVIAPSAACRVERYNCQQCRWRRRQCSGRGHLARAARGPNSVTEPEHAAFDHRSAAYLKPRFRLHLPEMPPYQVPQSRWACLLHGRRVPHIKSGRLSPAHRLSVSEFSVKLQRGVLVATLEKVLLELFLIFEPTFHPAVAWCLAQFYQRKDEKPEPIGRTLWENGPPTCRVGGEGRAKDVLKLLHLPRSNFFEVVGRRGGHPTLPPMFSQKNWVIFFVVIIRKLPVTHWTVRLTK